MRKPLFVLLLTPLLFLGCVSYRADDINIETEVYRPTDRVERNQVFLGEKMADRGYTPHALGRAGLSFFNPDPQSLPYSNPAMINSFQGIAVGGAAYGGQVDAQIRIDSVSTSDVAYGATSYSRNLRLALGFAASTEDKIGFAAAYHPIRNFRFSHDISHVEYGYDTDTYRYNYDSDGGLEGGSLAMAYGDGTTGASFGFCLTYLKGSSSYSYVMDDSTSITGFEQRDGRATLYGGALTLSGQYIRVSEGGERETALGLRIRPGEWIEADAVHPVFAPDRVDYFTLHYPGEFTAALKVRQKRLSFLAELGLSVPIFDYVSGFENESVSDHLKAEARGGLAAVLEGDFIQVETGIALGKSEATFGLGTSLFPSDKMELQFAFQSGSARGENNYTIIGGIIFREAFAADPDHDKPETPPLKHPAEE